MAEETDTPTTPSDMDPSTGDAEQAAKVREVGHYEALEDEGNSVAISDDAYVGVSPEYKNYANDHDAPLVSEEGDESDLVKAQQDREAALSTTNKVKATHPSEATHAVNPTLPEAQATPKGRR